MGQLQNLGFSPKDVDEVKEIFADANIYLLCGTLLIGSIHVSYQIQPSMAPGNNFATHLDFVRLSVL